MGKKFMVYALVGAILISSFNNIEASNICKRAVTKRLLSVLGINPDKTECFIKSKRDIAHLIDAVHDLTYDNGVFKRNFDGQYCCSPSCDRYMRHMNIQPKFVEC